MALLDWIIVGCIAVALIVIAQIVLSKMSTLASLDLDAMPKAKLQTRKYQLIEQRMLRKFAGVFDFLRKVSKPAQEWWKNTYDKLIELEHKYRYAGHRPKTQEEKEKARQKIAELMEKGAELYKEAKYGEAEHLFLDVLRLNAQEVEAYEYLGEIYMQKKRYDEALETLDYARQLNPEDERIYYDLGMVYRVMGDMGKCIEQFSKCVSLAPKNPRHLDLLIEVAVEAEEKQLARDAWRQLKEVNPDNQKLDALDEMIRKIKMA